MSRTPTREADFFQIAEADRGTADPADVAHGTLQSCIEYIGGASAGVSGGVAEPELDESVGSSRAIGDAVALGVPEREADGVGHLVVVGGGAHSE